MEYKVIVTVDGESWQLTNQQGKVDLISKRDKDYLHRVYLVLQRAVARIIEQDRMLPHIGGTEII